MNESSLSVALLSMLHPSMDPLVHSLFLMLPDAGEGMTQLERAASRSISRRNLTQLESVCECLRVSANVRSSDDRRADLQEIPRNREGRERERERRRSSGILIWNSPSLTSILLGPWPWKDLS